MKTWDSSEDKILLENPHLPYTTLSKILDRSIESIRKRLSRLDKNSNKEKQIWIEKEDCYELKIKSHKILVDKYKIDLIQNHRWILSISSSGNIYAFRHQAKKYTYIMKLQVIN